MGKEEQQLSKELKAVLAQRYGQRGTSTSCDLDLNNGGETNASLLSLHTAQLKITLGDIHWREFLGVVPSYRSVSLGLHIVRDVLCSKEPLDKDNALVDEALSLRPLVPTPVAPPLPPCEHGCSTHCPSIGSPSSVPTGNPPPYSYPVSSATSAAARTVSTL